MDGSLRMFDHLFLMPPNSVHSCHVQSLDPLTGGLDPKVAGLQKQTLGHPVKGRTCYSLRNTCGSMYEKKVRV